MIAIIDYGVGNLRSVEKAFEKVGVEAKITTSPEMINKACGLVLPGVGAFGDAMQNLHKSGLVPTLLKNIEDGKPLLGICLGLQLLFSYSEEGGLFEGLNVIPGRVIRFKGNVKVPQVGWNQIKKKKDSLLLKGIEDGENFYFVHSYYVVPDEKECILATTEYSVEFPSVVGKGLIFGIQFHPEKSSDKGLRILKNFGELVK
ncbi:MAG: imidazole glycerol-phosphate synthase subunit HisH [Thermosediminibacterales bacterium]|nr:imidazole glycerol-phosphate synthase subunit HisH [Thermosediminibacterales bacterium]MDK2835905.1 imidazole glycerol-phosphate synthase subunit HisH [Thermosediminibacterales bacterium]